MPKKIIDMGEMTFQSGEFVPPYTSIKPLGNQVLVERICESELSNSTILQTSGDKPSHQAYILGLGPMIPKDYGLVVGARVLLQGSFVPVPKNGNEKREKNLVLPDMIKAILE